MSDTRHNSLRNLDVEIIGALISLFDYTTAIKFGLYDLRSKFCDHIAKAHDDKSAAEEQLKALHEFTEEVEGKYKILVGNVDALLKSARGRDGTG